MRGKHENVLESILWFSGSNLFRQAVGALTAFLRPFLLPPHWFGLWMLLRLIPTYASFLHLGSRTAMRFLIPMHAARGETDRVERLTGTVYRGSLVTNAAAAVILVLLASNPSWSLELRLGLFSSAVAILLNWLFEHAISQLKGHRRFRLVSAGLFVNTSASFLANAALIYWLGIYGALLALPVAMAASLAFMAWRGAIERPAPFDVALFSGAVRMGAPTMLFDFILLSARNLDKLLVGYLLGNTPLGHYGLGAMIMGYLLNVPGASREVLEGRLFADIGKGGGAAFEQHFLRPTLAMAWLMPVVIGPAVLAAPVLVPWLLPAYAPAVEATRLLAYGGFFLALSYPSRGILVARNWQTAAAGVGAAGLAVNAVVTIALIRGGWGLNGAAIGTGAGFAVMAVGLFLLIARLSGVTWWDLATRLPLFLPPFAAMILVVEAAEEVGRRAVSANPWAALAVELLLYGAFVAGLLWLGRRVGILTWGSGS